jgi:translation initiation factor IF-3
VTLRYRGREMAHQEFGYRLIERIKNELEPHSVVEQFPKMEGRQMVMVLAPKKAALPVAAKKKAVSKEVAKPKEVSKPAVVAAPASAEAEKK